MPSRFTPIAIVGYDAILPDAPAPDDFWRNILARRCSARDVPAERWIAAPDLLFDPRPGVPDRVYSRRACLLDGIGPLNAAEFGLDAATLDGLDPLFQLTLKVGRGAWRSAPGLAGIDPSRAGIIIANIVLPTTGAVNLTAAMLDGPLASAASRSRRAFIEARPAALPAELLRASLGLGGACMTLDAACASSLYAIKLACDELAERRADAMLTGGVSRPDCLFTQMGFSQLRALSARGIPSPFDSAADGLVTGEGAAFFVLKRLDDAVAAGDHIHGVIRGAGLSNDRGGSLLAPDSEGQLRAMRAAYASAGWNPRDVDLIECHATGTPIGDATEVKSLRTLWADGEGSGRAAIGSVKSNIGHLLTGAGAAGVLKLVLAMRERTLPPTANFTKAASALPLDGAPFYIQNEPAPWETRADRPRRAAASAFGFGGINAHLLIEEWNPEAAARQSPPPPVNSPLDIAIVGIGLKAAGAASARVFQEAVFNGRSIAGAFDSVDASPNEFRIPPRELEEMLPQQLLMLQAVAAALNDAGGLEESRLERTGALIGIGLDLNTTNYALRWALEAKAREWNTQRGLGLDEVEITAWIERMKAATGPALTANRTVGGLGGMVASRVAREFRFGGPSFTISSEEASCADAVAVACRALSRGEIDQAITGGVDLCGEARLGHDAPLTEGAAAFVLMRADDARAQGRRVYAVIRGVMRASGDVGATTALRTAFAHGDCPPDSIDLLELSGVVPPIEIVEVFDDTRDLPMAVADSTEHAGACGAALAAFALAGAALAAYQQVLPAGDAALATRLLSGGAGESLIHVPLAPQHWTRDRADGPRRNALAISGGCGAAAFVLEESTLAPDSQPLPQIEIEMRDPAGISGEALFVCRADDATGLLKSLRTLRALAEPRADLPIESLARLHFNTTRNDRGNRAVALVGSAPADLVAKIDRALHALVASEDKPLDLFGQVFYSPRPLAREGHLAFVIPGSGNTYPGMGVDAAARWPEVLRALDAKSQHLRSQLMPRDLAPWRLDWREGWDADARARLLHNQDALIIGHVAHAIFMSDLLRNFMGDPRAVIGYSLGESSGYFAMGAWNAPDARDEMLRRITESPLFKTELVGPCLAARRAWGLSSTEGVDWRLGVVDRPAAEVREALAGLPRVYLLIVNAPRECVIGGQGAAVREAVARLGCLFHPLDGISTVHCEITEQVRAAYHDLHLFDTHAPEGIRFYSGAKGAEIIPSREACADSILAQALHGIDFPKTIEAAYADGARLFVETGPRNSCSRMIARILEGRPHMARSACVQGQNDVTSMLRLLAHLAAEGVEIDLEKLYGRETLAVGAHAEAVAPSPNAMIRIPARFEFDASHLPQPPVTARSVALSVQARPETIIAAEVGLQSRPTAIPAGAIALADYSSAILSGRAQAAAAHEAFLAVSARQIAAQAGLLAWQGALLAGMPADAAVGLLAPAPATNSAPPATPAPLFDRPLCLEFARGRIAPMFGEAFAPVDSHPTRVRLPDEPLMFVDRITALEGEPRSLASGRVETWHDVHPGAWYLDGGVMPTGFAVEAGQADLLLSAYLGIDFETLGLARYRLLDAVVEFHRGLPRAGESIRYDIHVERFIRQGDTHLFFFHFDGWIGAERLVTMRNGCAGFFTQKQLEDGRGIILSEMERIAPPGKLPADWRGLAPMRRESFGERELNALRAGDLASAFGGPFAALPVRSPMRLPSGTMKLIDRVTDLDPAGGRHGIGFVRSEIDIHPDDWFLTCHFTDDPVMPGTLMYESCMHTLRVFLMRMGWIAEEGQAAWEPLIGVRSKLRCRGQVLPTSRVAAYKIHIKELGYGPEPFAIADAMMFADGHPIVWITDMSIRLTGATRGGIESLWTNGNQDTCIAPAEHTHEAKPAIYTREQILEYCEGRPSLCFGERLAPFDDKRFLARLPRPPYLFLDRVTGIEGTPFELKVGTRAEGQYDIPVDAWYFGANRQRHMPFSVLLEFPLQLCGWLSCYMGSALQSDEDLHYRNLGGTAKLLRPVTVGTGTLTTESRVTQLAKSGGMLIQRFDLRVSQGGETVYEGNTSFGFFSKAALADQLGVRGAKPYEPTPDELARSRRFDFTPEAPLTPDDPAPAPHPALVMPAKAYRMIDAVEVWVPDGGRHGLGFIRGVKRVDPSEWFFRAHFYQDPVTPGSLGLEAFLQLLKLIAIERWGAEIGATHEFISFPLGLEHEWVYRGQVIPRNERVVVQACLSRIDDASHTIVADGFLMTDGLVIYEMKNFAVQAIPAEGGLV